MNQSVSEHMRFDALFRDSQMILRTSVDEIRGGFLCELDVPKIVF